MLLCGSQNNFDMDSETRTQVIRLAQEGLLPDEPFGQPGPPTLDPLVFISQGLGFQACANPSGTCSVSYSKSIQCVRTHQAYAIIIEALFYMFNE